MAKKQIVALYERLSHDDERRKGDSLSIANQKALLEDYAATHGFTNCVHYTDDGISGLRFDRPGYVEMMKEVEAGNVVACLAKDTSRIGRDYLKVGMCMETLRAYGVRLICVDDGIDTAQGEDDFTPFRTIMHEFYARDTSRKIRSSYKVKDNAGKPIMSTTPYGFLKDPNNKSKWLVDDEAAAVVRRIFQMTLDGKGPYQICCALKADKVLIPAAHMAKHSAGLHQHTVFKDEYNWGSSTVCNILKKREYLGHTVNYKTRKHFKDKKSHYVDESEWTIHPNTHEPIIDEVTFENVQRIRGNVKRRPDGWGYVHPLTGMLFCADCGGKLYCHRITNGKDRPTYVCGNYAKGSAQVYSGIVCESGHRIDAALVMELVRDTLKAIADYAKNDKAAFAKAVQEKLAARQTNDVKEQRKRLAVCERRFEELKTLFTKSFEEFALGRLPESQYSALSAKYQAEQIEVDKEIAALKATVDSYDSGSNHADEFMALVKKYEDFNELTVTMLHEFVEKIIVHERDRKGKIDSPQQIDIYLNFIGEFAPPAVEIDPAEQARLDEEERATLERRERFRQNYLKRKESGKQREYEQRVKYKRKARLEANKAALFAEGATLGAAAYAPLPVPVGAV